MPNPMDDVNWESVGRTVDSIADSLDRFMMGLSVAEQGVIYTECLDIVIGAYSKMLQLNPEVAEIVKLDLRNNSLLQALENMGFNWKPATVEVTIESEMEVHDGDI